MDKNQQAEDRELILQARLAFENAHAPYSGRAFGAAVRSIDGRIFTGCTVETVAFTGSYCAEQVAIGSAVAAGAKDLIDIALYPASYPCGLCRQVMLEFSENFVLTIEKDGELTKLTMQELLPDTFGPRRQDNFSGG